MNSTHKRFLKHAITLGTFALVAYFWSLYFIRNWGQIKNVQWQLDPAPLTIGCLIILTGYGLMGLLWSRVLYLFTGLRTGFVDAFRVSAISWMGRYLPGKVWTVLGKAYLSSPDRSHLPAISVAATVETLLSQMGGLVVAIALLPLMGEDRSMSPVLVRVGVPFLIMAFLGLHPFLLGRSLNWILRRLKRDPLSRIPRYRSLIALLGCYMIVFVFWGVGFFLLLRSMSPAVGIRDIPFVVFLLSGSWVMGFLVLLAPAGLGIRDSILAVGLAQLFHAEAGLVIEGVVGSRLVFTLIEALCFGIALLIGRMRKREQRKTNDNA